MFSHANAAALRRGLLPVSDRSANVAVAAVFLVLCLLTATAPAQESSGRRGLAPGRFKSGAITLRAFIPVVESTLESIVKLNLDDETAALGTIIDAKGLVITKASEIKKGKLICQLADGDEVEAKILASDDDNDVALIKIGATGLKPIKWSSADTSVGQWVVTPGTDATPEAVGIISVPPRKILPKRALIGVMHDVKVTTPKITGITPGLGAEKAGLKAGDVILAVNDAPVKKWEDLANTLRKFRDGQTVKLRVQREDQEFDAEVQMMAEELAFGSPRGRGFFNRQERMNRMGGDLSERAEGFELAIQHDTVLQPWQCGGPLLDLEGNAIGLNIARAGRVASYALPTTLIKQLIEELKTKAIVTIETSTTKPESKK